jgi:hypothetical protein
MGASGKSTGKRVAHRHAVTRSGNRLHILPDCCPRPRPSGKGPSNCAAYPFHRCGTREVPPMQEPAGFDWRLYAKRVRSVLARPCGSRWVDLGGLF